MTIGFVLMLHIIRIQGDQAALFLLHIQKLNQPIFGQIVNRMLFIQMSQLNSNLILFHKQQRTYTPPSITKDLYLSIILITRNGDLVVELSAST